jgi:hypothetical protein
MIVILAGATGFLVGGAGIAVAAAVLAQAASRFTRFVRARH